MARQALAKLAFLGLGVMGGPMARHLAAKGHQVTVFNRTAAKAAAWVAAHGGSSAATPREAAAAADFVLACVGNDDDLRSICLATANEIGARLPVTALVDQFYKDVQLMGGGRNDTSSLIRRLK